jgi:hypothetical protein
MSLINDSLKATLISMTNTVADPTDEYVGIKEKAITINLSFLKKRKRQKMTENDKKNK